MKRLILISAISVTLQLNAQTYLIRFTGAGASSNVSTVKVENLNRGTSITLNGIDVLRLNVTTGISDVENQQPAALKIYPNPMTEFSTLEISPPASGTALISIFEITGKPVLQVNEYLTNERQSFRIMGIKEGFYLVSVKGGKYQLSGKLVSKGKSDVTPRFEKVNNIVQDLDYKRVNSDSKGVQATIDMAYTAGDRLKFTGKSGIYGTVKTDIPTSDKTINFNFTSCTDGSNNNYSVVEIGNQVWMAENLRTTSYSNGTAIPTTTADISGETNPRYQWAYDDNPANVAIYGRLYTWYVVSYTRNVCPTGWHVPTDTEWESLKVFLGGETAGGEKLKETGTLHWQSPNTGATDETGFTALPAGFRSNSGTYASLGISCYFWSSTQNPYTADWGWGQGMFYDSGILLRGGYWKVDGVPVRCLKN
jgi:uncharacterized protein (TIGR02145 family)